MLKVICGIVLVAAFHVHLNGQDRPAPPCVPSSSKVLAPGAEPCMFLMGRIDQPGIHRHELGMTVGQLVDKAGGIATTSRVVIWRVVKDQRIQLGATMESRLQPNDAVEIRALEIRPELTDTPLPRRMPTASLVTLLRQRGFTR